MYPALAVLRALRISYEGKLESGEGRSQYSLPGRELEVLWVGGEEGIEVDLLSREEIPFTTIPAAGIHGVGLKALPGNLWRMLQGFISARQIIRDFQPQVMFTTGGYLAVPVAFASRLSRFQLERTRIAVYVPDIEPGLALRITARLSDQIMLTVEDSMDYFGNRSNVQVTGYPTRLGLEKSARDKALQFFNLQPGLPTLLVFGGSKGARSINQATISVLEQLLAQMQVIHISGQLDWPEVEAAAGQLPGYLAERYRSFAYLYQDMGTALSAADLVVSRAGASVLGEFPLHGLPAILIPYPHAWRYQEVNALYLESKGAALVLQDHDLNVHFYPTVSKLMKDHQMRSEMSQAMSSLANPRAAESIANLLRGLVSVPSPGRI